MADETINAALPLRDRLISGVLQLFGWCLVLEGISPVVVAYTSVTKISNPFAVPLFILIGVLLYAVGYTWPPSNPETRALFGPIIEPIASNYWYWLGAVFLLWLTLLMPIVRAAKLDSMQAEIADIRSVLIHYVMPRHLTDYQKVQIIAYLTDPSRPPQNIKLVVVNDSEAIDFGNDLSDALQASHWTIQATQISLIDFIAQSDNTQPEGLFYMDQYVCAPGSSPNATAEQFFNEAMARAKVHLTGGSGGCSPTPKYPGLRIMVGLRPKTWHPEMKEVPADE